ncbi:hypothetical protein OESDEN_13816, partial [Oesophagostomum dentatum]
MRYCNESSTSTSEACDLQDLRLSAVTKSVMDESSMNPDHVGGYRVAAATFS